MIAHTIFFYFFSIISIASALMVIATRNTVHAVFFLILDFISVGCLFIMIGAEFLGMIMLIVYVGAVAVLFLFVVMMLNVAERQDDKKIQSKSTHIPIGLIVSIIILAEVLVVVGGWKYKTNFIKTELLQLDENFTNTHMLGNVLYTEYIHLFQVAGIILLLAMIGAIVLTFRKREGVKRQSYINQISRHRETSISLEEVKFKAGVKIDD
ncbi:MAG: NADH-quinone oxidoreductase subunit J [Proteobacteria bacterium]|jgi:NADH-quinone oxidoreductase subunit J|nr:NADH-quinone oxidoreductase subunit J [Pseudomonadota bacterium]